MTSEEKNALDRLVAAYEKMLARVHETVERAESHVPALKQNLDQAREKAVELGELTREEGEKVASYVERDIHDAAVYISETGQQLKEWWDFDLKQVEARVLEMFIGVADQTRLQLREMTENLRRAELYHTGEVTGPGTLVCTGCGKAMQFKKPGHIPPCPGCHKTEFRREIIEE
jgi:rubrerythrin